MPSTLEHGASAVHCVTVYCCLLVFTCMPDSTYIDTGAEVDIRYSPNHDSW